MCDSASAGLHGPGGQRMPRYPCGLVGEAVVHVSLGLRRGPASFQERLGRGKRRKSFPSIVQVMNSWKKSSGREMAEHLQHHYPQIRVAGVERLSPCRRRSDKGQRRQRRDHRVRCWEVSSACLLIGHCTEKA